MPCLSNGTLIATETDNVAVENLLVGDKIMTKDHKFQKIRRICSKRLTGRQLLDNPHLRPVLVRKDAFDAGMPDKDTLISPNTRLPVAGEKSRLLRRVVEQKVAVKTMIDSATIQQIDSVGIDYYIVQFDRHEFIAANGFWVESFNPADTSEGFHSNSQRLEVLEIFPELRIERSPMRRPDAGAVAVMARNLRIA